MKQEPIWLEKAFALLLHQTMIERTGGSHGVRSESLLESALERPKNLYHYQQADIFQLAACYAEALSGNHPFIDGNKRIAFAAAGLFLELNGYQIPVEQNNEQEQLFLRLADGKLSHSELSEWYKENSFTEIEKP